MPPGDPPTKVCPECAETVLAAARRCRFCGFRFEDADPAGEPLPGLLRLIIRKPPPRSLSAQLALWGVELDDDEDCHGLWNCRVDGRASFLAVTTHRLLTVDASGGTAMTERPLADVRKVELVTRPLRAGRLRLHRPGPTATTPTTIDGLPARHLRHLAELLSAGVRLG